MRLKRLGTLLLFLAVVVCFLPTLVLPFLDRIYYEGPPGEHFDGERFFNPGSRPYGGSPAAFFNRWATSDERAVWPEHVPVRPTVPPAQVKGEEMLVTWIGHATVLVQTQGLNILTDPIWSERASPFSFAGPKRVRVPGVAFEDLPKIDIVLVSHNHYDHMDLATLKRLWERDRPAIVTSLGNDTILRGEGIEAAALDWKGRYVLGEGVVEDRGMRTFTLWEAGREPNPRVEVIVERNHHWSSRWGTDRNRALWSAFTLRLPGGSIFVAGDTGWGDGSWVREAAAHGPFRLAIIPIGAYEPRNFMKINHIDPVEAVRIFEALDPERALGVHWGTFQLTFEGINEPVEMLEALKSKRGIAPGRFLATEAGESFRVPAIQ